MIEQGKMSISFNLNRNKHIRAMKRAEELLNVINMDAPNINDSLNCGKFNMKYLKEMHATNKTQITLFFSFLMIMTYNIIVGKLSVLS